MEQSYISQSPHIQDLHDIKTAIGKFITFAQHIRDELQHNQDCNHNGNTWDITSVRYDLGKGYYELLGSIVKGYQVGKKRISAKDIISVLTQLLLEGYLDDDYNTYVDVYRLNIELYRLTNYEDSDSRDKLKQKGVEVYNLHHVKLIAGPIVCEEKEQNQSKVELLLSKTTDTEQDNETKQLVNHIIQAFELDISDIYQRNELIALLYNLGIIGAKEIGYFGTIKSHRDFVFYLKTILNNSSDFWTNITEEDINELERCFYASDLYYGDSYNINTPDGELIESLAQELVGILLSGNYSQLSDNFLNNFLMVLEEYFPYKPFYMKLIHIEFDEVLELPVEFNKALQIVGILICDVFEANNPVFENAYQFYQTNTRHGRTKVGVERMYTSKMLDLEKSTKQ